MDTSEEYIKMCDCPEIQEQWKPKQGDRYVCPEWQQKPYQILIKPDPDCHLCSFRLPGIREVWLPRQDQIQGMIPKYRTEFDLLLDFADWLDANWRVGQGESLEQLWLKFYMHEEHNKVWNGKEWGTE